MNTESTILVADDDPMLRKVLSRVFGSRFEVLTASDGVEAFELVSTRSVDLVILDVALPGMEGRAVARRMREAPATRDVPILMVSGLDAPEDQRDGFAAGADVYMTKPFEMDELWDRAKGLLRRDPD